MLCRGLFRRASIENTRAVHGSGHLVDDVDRLIFIDSFAPAESKQGPVALDSIRARDEAEQDVPELRAGSTYAAATRPCRTSSLLLVDMLSWSVY
jgi:hypothetical protein